MPLWIPPSARASQHVGYFCRMCKAQFLESERLQWEHHVVRCGEENHDAILRARKPMHEWNAEVDPEWGDYNRALEAKGINPERQYDRKLRGSVKRNLLES